MLAAFIDRRRRARECLVNPTEFIDAYYGLTDKSFTARLLGGGQVAIRPRGLHQTADVDIFDEVVISDVYGLRNMNLKGCFVVDVGAHVGIFSILALSLGVTRLIAVEPEDENHKALLDNLVSNEPIHARAIKMAVYPADIVTLSISPENNGAHVVNGFMNPAGQIVQRCRASPLSSIPEIADAAYIDLLKIDCEGGELLCLEDKATINKTGAVVMETHDWLGDDRTLQQVKVRLSEFGFHVVVLKRVRSAEGEFNIIWGHR